MINTFLVIDFERRRVTSLDDARAAWRTAQRSGVVVLGIETKVEVVQVGQVVKASAAAPEVTLIQDWDEPPKK